LIFYLLANADDGVSGGDCVGCFCGWGEEGAGDDEILSDGVWVRFLMFSLDFTKMYTGDGLSRVLAGCLDDMGIQKKQKFRANTEWTAGGRPCTCVNISWHSPWRHIEGMNRPETNAQRREILLNHSTESVSTRVNGHWNDGDCFGCDVMRLAVLDRWGVVSSRQTSDDKRGATSETTD